MLREDALTAASPLHGELLEYVLYPYVHLCLQLRMMNETDAFALSQTATRTARRSTP
jgi:hypothetical protein